jgi:hypothetical protein
MRSKKPSRTWLEEIVNRVDRAFKRLPQPVWLNDDWPIWVQNVGRELSKTFYPTAKLKFQNWEPGEIGAMLGQHIAYFGSLGYVLEVDEKKIDWKKLRLVYGKDIKKRVQVYEKKFNEQFLPDFERALKFALRLAIEQDYRPCSKFFAAFGRGIERRVLSTGEIGRTNTRIYLLLMMAWRSVEKLRSIPELHRSLCRIFGTHLVGDLKRIEKMCQRLDLRFGPRGRPRRTEIQTKQG